MPEAFAQGINAMLKANGSDWVNVEDPAKAAMRIATDESINGE
jgi:hypothetical protein